MNEKVHAKMTTQELVEDRLEALENQLNHVMTAFVDYVEE